MHEFLIGVLIVAIVAIQTFVFIITLDKIKIFKKILPNQENFKTVKVFIKEEDIETVSLEDIFKNLGAYTKNQEIVEAPEFDYKTSNHNEELTETMLIEEDSNYFKKDLFSDPSLCYIEKNGEKQRISIGVLSHYEGLGWTRII